MVGLAWVRRVTQRTASDGHMSQVLEQLLFSGVLEAAGAQQGDDSSVYRKCGGAFAGSHPSAGLCFAAVECRLLEQASSQCRPALHCWSLSAQRYASLAAPSAHQRNASAAGTDTMSERAVHL